MISAILEHLDKYQFMKISIYENINMFKDYIKYGQYEIIFNIIISKIIYRNIVIP